MCNYSITRVSQQKQTNGSGDTEDGPSSIAQVCCEKSCPDVFLVCRCRLNTRKKKISMLQDDAGSLGDECWQRLPPEVVEMIMNSMSLEDVSERERLNREKLPQNTVMCETDETSCVQIRMTYLSRAPLARQWAIQHAPRAIKSMHGRKKVHISCTKVRIC